MAVIIRPTLGSDPETLTNTAEEIIFPGLTSGGEKFLHDLVTDDWYIFDSSVTSYVKIDTTFENLLNSSQSYKISDFQTQVNGLLESTATSYGYNSIDNAISYYNSGITAWRNEAIAFNTWRDNTIDLMYDNIYSYTADGITLPSISGFTGQVGYFDVGITASRPTLFS